MCGGVGCAIRDEVRGAWFVVQVTRDTGIRAIVEINRPLPHTRYRITVVRDIRFDFFRGRGRRRGRFEQNRITNPESRTALREPRNPNPAPRTSHRVPCNAHPEPVTRITKHPIPTEIYKHFERLLIIPTFVCYKIRCGLRPNWNVGTID